MLFQLASLERALAEANGYRSTQSKLQFAVQIGAKPIAVTLTDSLTAVPGTSPNAAFTLIASPEAWDEFAKPVPAMGYQSIVAMVRMGHLSVEGDMLEFGRHRLFLEQLFAALRPKSEPEARGPEEHEGRRLSSPWPGGICGSISMGGGTAFLSRGRARDTARPPAHRRWRRATVSGTLSTAARASCLASAASAEAGRAGADDHQAFTATSRTCSMGLPASGPAVHRSGFTRSPSI